MLTSPSNGGYFIDRIRAYLTAWGYREIEVPVLLPEVMFRSCTEGTENRMFSVGTNMVLTPEVTNFIRALGTLRLGTNKVFYVARCFRDETTTDRTRLREFTQIGVELLGDNALDCRKVVRKDAIKLFRILVPPVGEDPERGTRRWRLVDGAERGLNLYDDSGKAFEIESLDSDSRQILGGGPYKGGAGWALGLERLMASEAL